MRKCEKGVLRVKYSYEMGIFDIFIFIKGDFVK